MQNKKVAIYYHWVYVCLQDVCLNTASHLASSLSFSEVYWVFKTGPARG